MRSGFVALAQPANQVVAAVNTAQVFPLASNVLTACTLMLPGSGRFDGRRFQVEAGGYLTTAGAYTAVVTLYAKKVLPANPLTAGNWTVIGASTARAIGTTSCPFFFLASLIVDSKSGKLQGNFQVEINNLLDAAAAVSNVLTGLAPGAGGDEPVCLFALGVTFNTGDAANVGNLSQFGIDG